MKRIFSIFLVSGLPLGLNEQMEALAAQLQEKHSEFTELSCLMLDEIDALYSTREDKTQLYELSLQVHAEFIGDIRALFTVTH